MRILIVFLLLSMVINAQDKGVLFLSENTMQLDKQQHALGGAFLGFVSYVYFDSNNRSKTEIGAFLKSAAFVGSIAILKEVNDKYLGNRYFSVDDIGATVFGQVTGSTIAYFLRKGAKKRIARKKAERQSKIAVIDEFYKPILEK